MPSGVELSVKDLVNAAFEHALHADEVAQLVVVSAIALVVEPVAVGVSPE